MTLSPESMTEEEIRSTVKSLLNAYPEGNTDGYRLRPVRIWAALLHLRQHSRERNHLRRKVAVGCRTRHVPTSLKDTEPGARIKQEAPPVPRHRQGAKVRHSVFRL